MEMREVLSREGRDAKNLLVYQFCDDTTNNAQSGGVLNGDAQQMFPNYRKPPVAPPRSPNSLNAPSQTPKKCRSPSSARQLNSSNQCTGPRVRSASTGRDKKSELQARYWALLFGNLQRAVNEIYQTVECYENISSCQEAILVLENYVRDFKALSEWFKVSWDYESRPLQQRPQSLAWEVRKSNPVPRVRAKSLSSPTASGKSSPALYICNSGKTSPSDGQMSPKKMFRAYDQLPKGAMRVNVRELFAANKRPTQEQIDIQPTQRDIPQTPMEEVKIEVHDHIVIEGMSHQYSQTDLEDDHLTLADLRKKLADLKEEQEQIEAQRAEEERQAQQAEEERQRQSAEEERLARCAEQERQNQLLGEIQLTHEVVQQEVPSNEVVPLNAEIELDDQMQAAAPEEKLPDLIPDTVEVSQSAEETKTTTCQDEVVIEPKPQTALELTVRQLDAMENALLDEQVTKPVVLSAASAKPIAEVLKKAPAPASTVPVANPVQNSPLKYSSVLNRPVAARTTIQKPATSATTAVAKTTKPTVNNSKPVPGPGMNGFRRTGTIANVNNRTSTMRATRNGAGAQPARPSSKTECHGPPNNVASRLSARSRTMIDMNGNKPIDKPMQRRVQPSNTTASNPRLSKTSSSVNNSRKSSHEDIGSSSSTLKASNEQIRSSRTNCSKVDEDSQTQTKQLAPDADDGWLTVKTRRRSSMHWSNRFHQPTGYASLPTLALLNEQQEQQREQENNLIKKTSPDTGSTAKVSAEKATNPVRLQKPPEKSAKHVPVRPEIRNAKAKVNSLPVQRKNMTNNVKKTEKSTVPEKSKTTIASRQSIIKRQKSDLTGLKMTSLHKEFMRIEKNALRKQQLINDKDHSNISSSAETVVEAPTANQSTDPDSSGDHNKIDIKIQTNREFSKTIGELYESIARTNKGEKLTNGCTKGSIATLSSCDENEEDGDEERNERLLIEEQELLERQIRELESTEIDIDTEMDETDCEVVLEDHDDYTDQSLDDAPAVVFVTMSDDENVSLELRYQALLSEMSWNERVETLATLQAFVTRHPGRAQELHQKLSSPSRRRSLQETLKKYQAKHARAQEKRELQQKEKSVRLQQLLTRVEAVKMAKKQLIEDKRVKMEGRLQRAAENREQFLRQIVEKAHDEEKKLKEINFIKSIEAQNKRLDLIESSKETEGRLQDLEQERQKRLEEKAAKEAAVERRRQELEKERQRKLERLNESRLEKEQRIGKMQEEKERQRQELAREKARDREERLLALQVQQQQTTEELQRKIQQKQLESARRHEENIEHIRQRALELTIPTRNTDEQRPENELTETDADTDTGNTPAHSEDCDHSSTISELGGREHSRSYKKKMKKLKQRMAQSAAEYFKEMEPLSAHVKRESQVPKLLHLITKGGGPQGLERDLGNLLRLLPKAQVCDFQTFLHMDGLGNIATNVILKGLDENSEISKRSITLAVQLYRNACSLCPQIARHALLGNSIATLFDAIIKSMQLPEEKSPQQPVELSTELMLACTEALSSKYVKKSTHPKVPERLPDVINYAVITGLVEILSRRCMKIRESIENNQSVMLSLLTTLGFLSRFIDVCPAGAADTTRLLNAAKTTDLFGTVAMLYASVVPIGECIPKRTISLAASAFNLFVSFATLDINTFQDIVGSEPVCVKLFDVMTILLNYCGNQTAMMKNSETQTMTIDLIATISFFCVNKRKHQDLLVTEQCSIIIKYLAKLPDYYNPVIYPCLVTMTYKNQNARNVISHDFNMELLEEYKKSDIAKKNHLIALIKDYA